MIKVNGEAYDYSDITVNELLKSLGYESKRIAVECNEDIIPKSEYETFIIHSGDVVEVVSFVGGG